MYKRDKEKIVALRLPNTDRKVSSCSSVIMLCFGYDCSVLVISGVLLLYIERFKILGKLDFWGNKLAEGSARKL